MNWWKASSVAFAMGVVILGGKVVFSESDASTGTNTPAQVGNWRERQPQMERALEALRAARGHLERANEHHGGWRVLALRNTDAAIADTVRGMEYGRAHPEE